MGSNTQKFKLYKADPVADGNNTFNIDTMLNDNWDKLDQALSSSDIGVPGGVAGLDESGKIQSAQLPDMSGYIPTSQKGTAGGVASLDESGKVPAGQLPSMDYDPSGTAASAVGTHNSASDAHAALFDAKVDAEELTAHTGDKNNPHGVTASQVGAAATSHNHSASNITSGTLSVARGGTGQTTLSPAVTTAAVRAIYAGTSDMTEGTSSLTTGTIYLVYQ